MKTLKQADQTAREGKEQTKTQQQQTEEYSSHPFIRNFLCPFFYPKAKGKQCANWLACARFRPSTSFLFLDERKYYHTEILYPSKPRDVPRQIG